MSSDGTDRGPASEPATGPEAAAAPATNWTLREVRPPEAAILAHPDQRSTWAPALLVRLHEPLAPRVAQRRLDVLAVSHSIIGARLVDGRWMVHPAPAITTFDGQLGSLCGRFDLAREAPLRVALSADRRELSLVAHHAALDGRALVAVARCLLGEELWGGAGAGAAGAASTPGRAADEPGPSARGGRRAMLRRLARPADRVAATRGGGAGLDAFVAVDVPEGLRLRVAPLSAAAVSAVADWNAERAAPWRRIGLTIPVGGPDVLGNVSTHRRVELRAGADVAALVTAALSASVPPADGGSPLVSRLLAPVIDRFSDSLLVSNLGRIALPGVEAIDFFPQARGRSAVAIGAASVDGGARRLTLRARDLSDDDARRLLARIVEQFPRD